MQRKDLRVAGKAGRPRRKWKEWPKTKTLRFQGRPWEALEDTGDAEAEDLAVQDGTLKARESPHRAKERHE